MNVLSDYPDIINVALVPMIIAVFVFAFPLLLQTITRIDDKYNSTKLIESFRNEPICKGYLSLLITSVFFCITWCLQMPRKCDLGWFNDIVDYSALIFICIGAVGLIIMTFAIVYLTYIYYYPEKLLAHLIKKYNRTKNKNNKARYFEAISKLLFYSIERADELLSRQLATFYYSAFVGFRKGKEGQIVEYPQEYNDAIFGANELLCKRDRRTISCFNEGALFDLYLDSFQHTIISHNTYNFLWHCLVQTIRYDRDDIIIAYWKKAHQLCNLFMGTIPPKYDKKSQKVINQDEIDKRYKEREIFLEFHYALGGLLMYKQKYEAIKEIMYFTQQQPPKYVLVPETMEEVIVRYMQISKLENFNPVYYEQKYPFPDVSGVNADSAIQMWIKRYLSILFLRQYTLYDEYYTYSNPLTMPQPPKALPEMKYWNDELDSLEYYVKYYLEKEEILKKLGLSDLCIDNWFINKNKEEPSVLINNFKSQIDTLFDKIKQEQEIDQEKEKEFITKSVEILKPTFEKYSTLFNNSKIGNNSKIHFIGGYRYILDKAAFVANQEISYSDSDSITAEAVNMNFQYDVLNTFVMMSPVKYSLGDKYVFLSIDNLKINPNEFIIISIGLNLEFFLHFNIDGFVKRGDKFYYKEMEIIDIYNNMNKLVNQSLFIIKREDMPHLNFAEIPKELIKKYQLEKVNNDFNIYTALIDLNKNKIIRQEIEKSNVKNDLLISVLAFVEIKAEIQYKSNVPCIQLKCFSQFDDRGTINKIDDVQSIWED